jgi:hypothetical protein
MCAYIWVSEGDCLEHLSSALSHMDVVDDKADLRTFMVLYSKPEANESAKKVRTLLKVDEIGLICLVEHQRLQRCQLDS